MARWAFDDAWLQTHLHSGDHQVIALGLVGDWNKSLDELLKDEGGNDDDPRDPGGRTSRGIIQTEWTAWRKAHPGNNWPADVWQAPQEQVEAIYRQQYWDALKCDELPGGVDYCVFDYGVNSGVGRGAKVLQQVLNVAQDGKVGPATLAAAAKANPAALVNDICDERLAFLKSLSTWGTFGRGWSARVDHVRRTSLAMIDAGPPKPPAPAPEHSTMIDFGQVLKHAMKMQGFPWGDCQVVTAEGYDPDGKRNKRRVNAFDDCKGVLDGDGKFLCGPFEASSRPGRYWTEHPMAEGGAFIIASGPQPEACWTPGEYHDLIVWRQADDSHIWGHRDPNCTYERQGPPVKHGAIGVHHHKGYSLPRNNIANAGAGCQIIRLNEEQEIFMRVTRAKFGKRMNATVLTQKMVDAAIEDLRKPKPVEAPKPEPKPDPKPVDKAMAAGAAAVTASAAATASGAVAHRWLEFGAGEVIAIAAIVLGAVLLGFAFWKWRKG